MLKPAFVLLSCAVAAHAYCNSMNHPPFNYGPRTSKAFPPGQCVFKVRNLSFNLPPLFFFFHPPTCTLLRLTVPNIPHPNISHAARKKRVERVVHNAGARLAIMVRVLHAHGRRDDQRSGRCTYVQKPHGEGLGGQSVSLRPRLLHGWYRRRVGRLRRRRKQHPTLLERHASSRANIPRHEGARRIWVRECFQE